MFYTYILYSSSHNRFYIGQTNNLEERLIRHNNGYVKSTKSFKPWILVYHEEFDTRSKAMIRETEIKKWKSADKIRALINASR